MQRLSLSRYEKRLLYTKDKENQGLKVYNNILDIEHRQRMKELCYRRHEFERRYSALLEIRNRSIAEHPGSVKRNQIYSSRRKRFMDTIDEDHVDNFRKKMDGTLKRIVEAPFGSKSETRCIKNSSNTEFDKGLIPNLPEIKICDTTIEDDFADNQKTIDKYDGQNDIPPGLNSNDRFMNDRRSSFRHMTSTSSLEARLKARRKVRRLSDVFGCVSPAERNHLELLYPGNQNHRRYSDELPSITTRGDSLCKYTFPQHNEMDRLSSSDASSFTRNSDSECSDFQAQQNSSAKTRTSPNRRLRKTSIVTTPKSWEISMLQMLMKIKKGQDKFKYVAKLLQDHIRQDDEVILTPGVSGTTWEETFSSCRYIRNVRKPDMPTQHE